MIFFPGSPHPGMGQADMFAEKFMDYRHTSIGSYHCTGLLRFFKTFVIHRDGTLRHHYHTTTYAHDMLENRRRHLPGVLHTTTRDYRTVDICRLMLHTHTHTARATLPALPCAPRALPRAQLNSGSICRIRPHTHTHTTHFNVRHPTRLPRVQKPSIQGCHI